MSSEKQRRQIAWEAARLMYERQESEYFRAKMKAARRVFHGRVRPSDLPNNAEIRDQVQRLAQLHEGPTRDSKLKEMRVEALRIMRLLSRFRPRLIGSTLSGAVRRGSDIDIHVFSDSIEPILAILEDQKMDFDVERKEIRKHGEFKTYRHIHLRDVFNTEFTVYSRELASYPFRCSITGKAIRGARIHELEALIKQNYPDLDIDEAVLEAENKVDRFQIYEMLLLPLEKVKQNPKFHPEGDALYHSLQVFELARQELPYDEDFLLAALLHDVGKAIDIGDHVQAGLEALQGVISDRTAWLIAHHMEANQLTRGTLGARAHKRLRESVDFDNLMLLAECDQNGRMPGANAPDVREAITYFRELLDMCGE